MAGMFELKGLREKRGEIRKKIDAIGTRIKVENRAMNNDERVAFDQLRADFYSVSDAIKTAEESLVSFSDAIDADAGTQSEPSGTDAARSAGRADVDHRPKRRNLDDAARRTYGLALSGWCRGQYNFPLTRDQTAACRAVGVDPRQREFAFPLAGVQTRTLGTSTSAPGGGNLIARDFSSAFELAMVSYSNVRGVVGEFRTDTGATLDFPVINDTASDGEQLDEATEVGYEDPTVTSVAFGAYKTSSKAILVNSELLQDAAFDLDSVLGSLLGERIGRSQGAKFTTGSGSGEPQGIVTAATLGVTTAGAAAITPAELVALAFSVDPAYQNGPSVGFMMHNSIAAYLLQLKDSSGQPIYSASFRDGVQRLVIGGYPVFVNQFMEPAVAGVPVTAKKHVLFGDMSKFMIRDAGSVRLRRLDERWAEKDQVGFIGFLRSDSRCVNTAAIKYLLQA